MLADLQWHSLQHWRYITRLNLFYNIVHSSSFLKFLAIFQMPLIPPTVTTLSILRSLLLEQITINSVTTPDLSVTGIT